MGNQQSTANTINDTVNKAMTNVLMNSSSNCSQNNSSVQELSFSDIKSDPGCRLNFSNISQTSVQTPNFTCSSDSKNNADLLNQFKTQLQQQAQATLSGIPGAINSQSVSNTVNKLQNDITNNINVNQVSNCVQNNLASQKAQFGHIESSCPGFCQTGCPPGYNCDMNLCSVDFNNISQSITQAAVAKCVSSNSTVTNAVNNAANDLSQTSSAKNTGIDFTSLSSLTTVWIIFIVAAVLLSCLIISSLFGVSQSDAGQQAIVKLSDAGATRLSGGLK